MKKHLANVFSILRIFLVLPICYLIIQQQMAAALGLFVIASLTDIIDGALARRYGITRFGSLLDPAADKLLILSTYSCFTYLGLLPIALLLIVIGRDIVLLAGIIAYYRLVGPPEFAATQLSKYNTALQVALLIALMSLQLLQLDQRDMLISALTLLVVLTTVLSCAQYVYLALTRQVSQGMEQSDDRHA
jgi:cardiolipin synthase